MYKISSVSALSSRIVISENCHFPQSFLPVFFSILRIRSPTWILSVKTNHTHAQATKVSRNQLCVPLRQQHGQFFAVREILFQSFSSLNLLQRREKEIAEISRDSRMDIKTRHTMSAAVRCLSTLRCRVCGKAHGSCHCASQWNYRKLVGDVYDCCRFNPASYTRYIPRTSAERSFASLMCPLTLTAGLSGYLAPCKPELERMHNAANMGLSTLSIEGILILNLCVIDIESIRERNEIRGWLMDQEPFRDSMRDGYRVDNPISRDYVAIGLPESPVEYYYTIRESAANAVTRFRHISRFLYRSDLAPSLSALHKTRCVHSRISRKSRSRSWFEHKSATARPDFHHFETRPRL